jgi:hypothetical protein
VDRAEKHYQAYGLANSADVGEAEIVTEVMFDRQFSRKAGTTCSRSRVRDKISAQLARNRAVEMVIPALPFKITSPLKARGEMPDLAEVGFFLSLYEIALAIEIASERRVPHAEKLTARFVVVSDGLRFSSLANVPVETIARYRTALEEWVSRLGLARYIVVEDYRELLRQRLPPRMLAEKREIAKAARILYEGVLSPVFNPCSMERTLAASRVLEPDPEKENADGRFVSLLRSLVYTINYRTLDVLNLSSSAKYDLYRELTSALFEPFEGAAHVAGSPIRKEDVRQAMLREAWQAAIDYMVEIKSDRELKEDPVLACLPGAIRWTIHAKAGQFAIASPSVGGAMVQAWAGTAVFRLTGSGAVRLSCYPVLGLEAGQAVPVVVSSSSASLEQPLFYIDRKLEPGSAEAFFETLAGRLTRRRLK